MSPNDCGDGLRTEYKYQQQQQKNERNPCPLIVIA